MLKGAVLYVKDLDRLARFYAALGGGILDQSEGEFAILRSGEAELIIVQAPTHVAARIVVEDPPVARSETPIKPVIGVPSLAAALAAVAEFGGAQGAEPWRFRGHLIQDIIDPEGNIIQLHQPD